MSKTAFPYRPVSEPEWVLQCKHIAGSEFKVKMLGDRKGGDGGNQVFCEICQEWRYLKREATIPELYRWHMEEQANGYHQKNGWQA